MKEEKEEIYRKLRKTVMEFGQTAVTPAIIIGPSDLGEQLSGHQYFIAPTIGSVTLINISFKIARFFEDI